MPNQVRVGVGVAGASKASSELDKFRDKFTKLQKQGAKGFVVGAGVAATNLAFNAAGMAIRGVTDLIGDATDAFLEDERSQQKLTTSLRANATAWDGTTSAIEQRIKTGQALGFSDDEQRSSLAELVGAYGDVTKSLEIMRTAMDLARFSGVDLGTASDTLIKVHAGNYRALKALGIQTKNITNETEALAAVQKIAAGQAEDFAQTAGGKLTVSMERSAEATERLGKAFAPIEVGLKELGATVFEGVGAVFDEDLRHAQKLESAMRTLSGLSDEEVRASLERAQKYGAEAGNINLIASATEYAARNFTHASDEAIGLRQSVDKLPGPLDDLTDAEKDNADAADEARKKTRDYNAMLGRLEDITDSLPDKLQDLEDALYGGDKAAGDLAQAQKDLADLMDEEPATKHKQEWVIWSGKVADAKQTIFDLQFQMAQAAGPEALDKWLRDQRDHLGAADKKGRDYLNTLIAINSLKLGPAARAALGRISGATGSSQPGGFGGKTLGGVANMAEGGIVPARPGGTLVNVGEAGHPEAIVPLSGPHAAGGSITINLNISTPMLTPGAGEDLMRTIGPLMARYLQRNGHLARAV